MMRMHRFIHLFSLLPSVFGANDTALTADRSGIENERTHGHHDRSLRVGGRI
jgi:hypothetical protein